MFAFSTTWAGNLSDVEYSRVGDVSLRMDAQIPPGNGPFPAAILVHGGAWVRGDRNYNVMPLFKPLEHAGFAWFSISYRLTTDLLTFGVAVDDVAEAVRFVRQHAAEYHVDPNRIALIGESAGAQLASMAALNGDPESRPNALVSLYGPSNLVSLAESSPLVPEAIRTAVQGTPFAGIIKARLGQLSPLQHLSKNMPPTLLIHGTSDTVVPYEQSKLLLEKAKALGADMELYTVPGGTHGIWAWERSGRLTAVNQYLMSWLKTKLPNG